MTLKRCFFVLCTLAALVVYANAETLVVLHTNDVHGNVLPYDRNDKGGMLRIKVVADSIRSVEKNVMLLDAGDDVQGFLYFSLFGGDVEYPLMEKMGYDVVTLGNHEFDNGLDRLADCYSRLSCPVVNANYTIAHKKLSERIKPFVIKRFAGKNIAVIGAGTDVSTVVSGDSGVGYSDPVAVVDSIATMLKLTRRADYVIALTHLGYDSDNGNNSCYDIKLAKQSAAIDLIVGGHSHSAVGKGGLPNVVNNRYGKPVLIAQTGNDGKRLGKIVIDLDNLDALPETEFITIDKRYDRPQPDVDKWLETYHAAVDSVMSIAVCRSSMDMPKGSAALGNFVADAIYDIAAGKSGLEIDLAVTNAGGIRSSLKKGVVSYGNIMMMVPFPNNIVVLEMDGALLQKCLDDIASTGGQCQSRQLAFDIVDKKAANVTINGKVIDPKKMYHVATISFVYEGKDNLVSFTNAKLVYKSENVMKYDILDYVKSLDECGKMLVTDTHFRFSK